jgi:Spy/CpxP family protein refolding chaperone
MEILNRKKLMTGCLGIIGAILVMNLAWAQPLDMPPMKDKDMQERGKKLFAEMAAKLKLSPEQQSMLDQNRKKHMHEFDNLMQQTFAKREELRKALDESQLDMQKVQRIQAELKGLMDQMEDQHLMAVLEIRKILTPHQFAEFQAMAPDRHGPPHPFGPPPDEQKQ